MGISMGDRLRWLPNALTAARIVAGLAVPVLALLGLPVAALVVFVVAALTDALDGWAARRLGAVSRLGATLDLWADKALVAGALLALCGDPLFWPLGAVGLLTFTFRDLVIMALRARYPGASLGASKLAKAKTALVMAGLAVILLAKALPEHPASTNEGVSITTSWVWAAYGGAFMLLGGACLSVLTGVLYFGAVRKTKS